MELFAICWRDTWEPWGWAPAIEDTGAVLPDGPFFWDRDDAEQALERVLTQAVAESFQALQEQDRNRHALEMEGYEKEVARGGRLPGVTVRFAGTDEEPPWKPRQPKPLQTEDSLRASARSLAEQDWSIQVYAVPVPPVPAGV